MRQYEKIQVHVLVKEGGNDYRTDYLDLHPWSPFPIEHQALQVYCRDIYLRFRNELELIRRYNVHPFGGNYYKLEPNSAFCGKYGSRMYLVIASKDEGLYTCECAKMEWDGLLCCHILKMFTHLGVDEIPDRYILRRWTQRAVSGYMPPVQDELPDVMPPKSQKQVRHANMNMTFSKLARLASATDEATAIVNKHICAAAIEISHLNKSNKKKKPATRPSNSVPTAGPSNSAPAEPIKPRDPPKTTTKGRTKSKRTISALELKPKRKIKCHAYGSVDHNSASCLGRLL
jgi:hypothetical protein